MINGDGLQGRKTINLVLGDERCDYCAPDSFLVFGLPLVMSLAPWSTRSFHDPQSQGL